MTPGDGPGGVEVHLAHETRTLDVEAARAVAQAVIDGEGLTAGDVGIVLADHATVHDLNREWLGHDYETDVVSFVLGEAPGVVDGEVYVDLDTAHERAAEFDTTPDREALRYVAHGVLHLCGHDDATDVQRAAMGALEDRYLTAAGA